MLVPNRRFLFLLCSTRSCGNTEQLAYAAAASLPPNAEQKWLHLMDYPLPNFVDLRHDGPYPAPFGSAKVLLEATLHATDLVLVAPLYWYSLPAPAKQYLDHWSGWMRLPNLAFRERMKGKSMWAVVASSGNRTETEPLEAMLKLTSQYMHMNWIGLLFGTGSRPNDIQEDALALQQAESFFSGPRSDMHLTTAVKADRIK